MNCFPRISIVTVSFNCKAIIEKTILSVINQAYSNIEYVVIDGASTDGTLDIIHKYESNIDILISERDEGIYDAMNKAISMATGEWIYFLNAGDVFASYNVLEKCHFQNKSEYAAIYGSYYSIRKGQRVHIPCDIPFWKSKKKFHGMGFSHQSVFVKTSLARKYPFDLSFKCCADYNMILTIYNTGGMFCNVNIPIAICDWQGGFSDKHRALQMREHGRILGIEHTLYFKILYMKSLLKLGIKKLIKK